MLELGCAGGGNLLPFALACPQVYDVVGGGPFIDADVGLAECESACHEPDGITPEFGRFDYIVGHGVFSCVPPEVRFGLALGQCSAWEPKRPPSS